MMSNTLDRDSQTLYFYFNPNCPYAQRSWITLLELGIGFEPVEIELGKDNKTDWFRAMNPNGTVPTIKHGETVLYESLVVNEYLCEVFDDNNLMPSTAGDRGEFSATRQDDLNIIRIGQERYEIPDAVVFGG